MVVLKRDNSTRKHDVVYPVVLNLHRQARRTKSTKEEEGRRYSDNPLSPLSTKGMAWKTYRLRTFESLVEW